MKQRIITAIAALIILVPLIVYGSWPFIVFAYIFAVIALFELIRIFQSEKKIVFIPIIFLCLFLYPVLGLQILPIDFTRYDLFVLFLIVLLMITVLTKNKFSFDQASLLFLATIYI